jgi:hypothetical protein
MGRSANFARSTQALTARSGPKSPFFVLTAKFDFALYRKTYGETTDKTYPT